MGVFNRYLLKIILRIKQLLNFIDQIEVQHIFHVHTKYQLYLKKLTQTRN